MEIFDYESVKTAFDGLKSGSLSNIKTALGQYQEHTGMTPDALIGFWNRRWYKNGIRMV